MNVFSLLKQLKWDLDTRTGRFNYAFCLVRNLPGNFGKKLRSQFIRKYLGNCGENLILWPGVRIRNVQNLSVGDNVNIGEDAFLQAAGGIRMGNDVLMGPGVKIWSTNHRFEDPDLPIRKQGYEFKEVVIGNNVWIGANSFIMPGAVIGNNVVISAGSVVGTKTIPAYTILAGNPARKIGQRKKEPDA